MTGTVRPPSLADLAFTSLVFPALTDYDESLGVLRQTVGGVPDLSLAADRRALHTWLNAWGCRLRVDSREPALEEVGAWYELHRDSLPHSEVRLWRLDDEALAVFAPIYADLCGRSAGFKATATSKTLYALQPHVFVPWDRAIRAGFQCNGSGESYARFLSQVRDHLQAVEKECHGHGMDFASLPEILRQPGRTVVDVVNQYYWATITRKVTPPGQKQLNQWLGWIDTGLLVDSGDN